MKAISVFCGSSLGNEKNYEEKAYALGKSLAQKNIRLVYGGADLGLMGAVANGALENEGQVFGVIPEFLSVKEIAHTGLTELIIVQTMHERKTKMNDLSDGIIALPGGFGTLEELFEILTWAQLGLHGKPIGILNIDGFYNNLMELLSSMVENGFLRAKNYKMLLVSDNIETLIQKMEDYVAPVVEKWITREKT